MSLAHRLMMSALPAAAPKGQQEWTTPGTYSFVVPVGVLFISAVGISGGNMGDSVTPFKGGGGGGLHWRNDIPVTPGETLTIIVGAKAPTVNQAKGGATSIKRGSTFLILVDQSTTFYSGGRGRFDLYGGGGGIGGAARGTGGDGGWGGGTAGYTGNGGRGGTVNTLPGEYPSPTDCGGGRGGNRKNPSDGGTGYIGYAGEGVGLQGRTADKAYGSLGSPKCGAGSASPGLTTAGQQDGGARIMWGGGRSYPDAAADI